MSPEIEEKKRNFLPPICAALLVALIVMGYMLWQTREALLDTELKISCLEGELDHYKKEQKPDQRSSLDEMVEASSKRIDEAYGPDAYGGSNWVKDHGIE